MHQNQSAPIAPPKVRTLAELVDTVYDVSHALHSLADNLGENLFGIGESKGETCASPSTVEGVLEDALGRLRETREKLENLNGRVRN